MSSSSTENPVSVLPSEETRQEVQPAKPERHSYGQILKSSALVGGSSAVNVAMGIVRTKAMAVLLGPAGFGLFGLYGSIINVTQTIAGLGVNSSGVRQIAEAIASENDEKIAVTTIVLRRVSILLGLLGAVFLAVFSRQVSALTFGNREHAGAVALLSLAVLFQLVSLGQSALIQGMRRMLDLAKLGVIGAVFGTIVSILLVYLLHENGVAASLVAVALMSLAFSWWYARTVQVQTVSLTVSQVFEEATALLKLGFVFMAAGFMTIGMAYVVRVILLRKVGFEATGYYQSAWALVGLYVGFILQAMGADFYPRLTASASDNAQCNRLVNEQTRVGLLLAGPGLMATLTFTPIIITLFYSAKFGAAVGVLRWICLGTILQVITWPMGFVIVAKARQAMYFMTELDWGLVSLALALICIGAFGLNGAGIAFFGSYVFYALILYPVVHRLSGFRWSPENIRTGLFFLFLIAIVFCSFYLLPLMGAASLGAIATIGTGIYSLRVLVTLISANRIPSPARRLLAKFGLISRSNE